MFEALIEFNLYQPKCLPKDMPLAKRKEEFEKFFDSPVVRYELHMAIFWELNSREFFLKFIAAICVVDRHLLFQSQQGKLQNGVRIMIKVISKDNRVTSMIFWFLYGLFGTCLLHCSGDFELFKCRLRHPFNRYYRIWFYFVMNIYAVVSAW